MSSPSMTVIARIQSPPPRNDTLKNSILANSQAGWGAATVVPPLKITKQRKSGSEDSIPDAAPRRTSSSFSHVRSSHLVANSPFKSPVLDSDGSAGPIGPKYRPVPQSQSGGYKVLPRPSKIPGVTPRKPSPSVVVASRRVSPATATRRASLEKRKRFQNEENLRKAAAMESAGLREGSPGLGISVPPPHPIGVPRRQSKGLTKLEKAEYVSKSPFIAGTKLSGSVSSSPSLTSSTTTSPQTQHQEESEDAEEPATPTTHESSPDIQVQDDRNDEPPSPDELVTEIPQHSSPATKASPSASLGVPPSSGRPLPASPRSRRAAASFHADSPTHYSPKPSAPSPPRHASPLPLSSATPVKSSLKSKRRLLGPRSPESPELRVQRTPSGRRRYGSLRKKYERRKTVTFDERCDVLEFEPDTEEEYVDSEWATSDDEGVVYEEWQEADDRDAEQLHVEEDGGEEEQEEVGDERIGDEDSINGLVNSILEDEMAGFRHDDDSFEQPSVETEEAERSADSRRSLDFHEANTSLDFHEANTSLDFQEGDSFEVEMQRATHHLFNRQPQSHTIHEENEDEGSETEHGTILPDDVRSPSPPRQNPPSPLELGNPDDQFDQQQHDELGSRGSHLSLPASNSGFGSSGTLSSSGSRMSHLAQSESAGSLSGRQSPRISREDIKRRLMNQTLGRSSPAETSDTEPEDGSPTPAAARSAFARANRKTSASSDDRPLPQVPTGMAPDMTRQGQSHDAVLQSNMRRDSSDPARAGPIERSLTTDGNLPASAYEHPPAHPSLARPHDYNKPGVDIADVKSALDRLMIGVENGFLDERTEPPPGTPHSRPTSFGGGSPSNLSGVMSVQAQSQPAQQHHQLDPIRSSHALHASTDAESDVFGATGRPISEAPKATVTRAKSGKEVIKAHEAHIIAKRREARRREGSMSSSRRPSKRRSLSTGDAEDVKRERRVLRNEAAELLDVPVEEVDLPLSDSIDRELRLLTNEKQPTYRLRELEPIIYAAADEKVSHMRRAGDVDSGKAWRAVRRPSDMNEYAKQLREYRNQEKPGKAHGKVFVKVLGIRGINVPLPPQPTAFNVTLNNGIHCVATPDCRLAQDSRIDQEFELIEHGQLEFTLTIKVRKDPHIVAQIQGLHASLPRHVPMPPPPPPPPAAAPAKGGFFGLFTPARKNTKTHKRASTQPEVSVRPQSQAQPMRPVEENLAKYLKTDGTLAMAFISFKEIAKRCDTRLFETSYPLVVQSIGGKAPSVTAPRQVGEIVLQVFRLPPLPGIKADQLPQSLEECHRGLRHIAWHKVTYHEGVLTQHGGDCSTWRRRHVRVIGANLVAFNDVTNKPTATIELKKALSVVDDQDPGTGPAKVAHDDNYHVERSFRLIFPDDEEITFFTDSDGEKARWLEILRALIGRIPPNPLWAELVWQRQEELLARSSAPSRSE